ncbi:hypothetical protein TNCV_3742111 [Trichonephila clavipes]|nr:hypothetical protein TNCV_3742111 [Trichonephila clavipes]
MKSPSIIHHLWTRRVPDWQPTAVRKESDMGEQQADVPLYGISPPLTAMVALHRLSILSTRFSYNSRGKRSNSSISICFSCWVSPLGCNRGARRLPKASSPYNSDLQLYSICRKR